MPPHLRNGQPAPPQQQQQQQSQQIPHGQQQNFNNMYPQGPSNAPVQNQNGNPYYGTSKHIFFFKFIATFF